MIKQEFLSFLKGIVLGLLLSLSPSYGEKVTYDQLPKLWKLKPSPSIKVLDQVFSHLSEGNFQKAERLLNRVKSSQNMKGQDGIIPYVELAKMHFSIRQLEILVSKYDFKNGSIKKRKSFSQAFESQASMVQNWLDEQSTNKKFDDSRSLISEQLIRLRLRYDLLACQHSEDASSIDNCRNRIAQDFEKHFERSLRGGKLATLENVDILNYQWLCEPLPTPASLLPMAAAPADLSKRAATCQRWLEKLNKFLIKGSAEQIALTKTLERNRALAVIAPLEGAVVPEVKKKEAPQDLLIFQRGYFLYIAGDLDGAAALWRELLRDYPNTNIKLRTKFWIARAGQRLGHQQHAERLYKEIIQEAPFSYYAFLTAAIGGIDPSRMIAATSPEMETRDEKLNEDQKDSLKGIEIFISNDAQLLAKIAIKDLIKSLRVSADYSTEFILYLAYLNHLAGSHRTSFRYYSELSKRGYTGHFSPLGERLVFPVAFDELIKKSSNDNKVNWLLVRSLIKQESAFDSEAVSSSDAFGLMQIILPTARDLESGINANQLIVPKKNVELGARYIASLLKRYNGNVILALAAYNAGPFNADRWNREINKALPVEEYIELIGFKETREYVQSILRNMFWYYRISKRESILDLNTWTQLEKIPQIR